LLGTTQVEQLECSWNRPIFVVNSLARLVRSIPDGPTFTSRERLAMLALVNDFSGAVGASERIVQTPVPLSYARHTSRFLTLWLWSLPWVSHLMHAQIHVACKGYSGDRIHLIATSRPAVL
jgi:predicted membrane chloride channel (bestrophin family)